jgi:hypothetical protein
MAVLSSAVAVASSSLLLSVVAAAAPRKTGDDDSDDDDDSYVFLQRFPLEGTGGFLFHTEVLVCDRSNFSPEDRDRLDAEASTLTDHDYVELDESWWSASDMGSVSCVELGYGGADCSETCCGVPLGESERSYPINGRHAVIPNAVGDQKILYLYGTGTFNGETAWHAVCNVDDDGKKKCWSQWRGIDYNPLSNNCNTFTSTVLSCVYGLSEKKPHLGPSDIVTVKCRDQCHPNNLYHGGAHEDERQQQAIR